MNPVSLVAIAGSLISLVLSIWLFVANTSAQGLQDELRKKQDELQTEQQQVQRQQQVLQLQQEQVNASSSRAQQTVPVLQDLAKVAATKKNQKIRDLLAKHGWTIQETTPTPKPNSTPSNSSTPNP